MAWTANATRQTYVATGNTLNFWADLQTAINGNVDGSGNRIVGSGVVIEETSVSGGGSFYTVDLENWGIEFGDPTGTVTTVTNAHMNPLSGSIRTQKNLTATDGSSPVFLVHAGATVTIDSTQATVAGLTTGVSAAFNGANFFAPWFEATGNLNILNWHHSGDSFAAPSMFMIQGSCTLTGLHLRVNDSPKTLSTATGGLINCIYTQTKYFAVGSSGPSRGSIFQKYDSGTFLLTGTTLLGGELLPNQAETFTGLTRQGSTSGAFNAGRANGPVTYLNPMFGFNVLDVSSENEGGGSQYPTTDVVNNANGFIGNFAWNAGSPQNANKGMIRLFKNITPNITDSAGAPVANATFFLRDVDRSPTQRRSVSLTGIPTGQTASATIARDLRYDLDKSYYVRTMAGTDGQSVFDSTTLSIANDQGASTASVQNNLLPILIAVATWNTGDANAIPFLAPGGPTLDIRTKPAASTANGLADTFDYVIWHYEDNPSVQRDVSFGGNGNLTIGDRLLPDPSITLDRNGVATLDLSLAGVTDIGITNTEIAVNADMTDTQIYDIIKYRKEQRSALIEIPSASTLAVTRADNTNNYLNRDLTLGGTNIVVSGNHINIGELDGGDSPNLTGLFAGNIANNMSPVQSNVEFDFDGLLTFNNDLTNGINFTNVTLTDGSSNLGDTGPTPILTNCTSTSDWQYRVFRDVIINGGNTGFTITSPEAGDWNVTNVSAGNFNVRFLLIPSGIINVTVDDASRDAVFGWRAALTDAERAMINVLAPPTIITAPVAGNFVLTGDGGTQSNSAVAVAANGGFNLRTEWDAFVAQAALDGVTPGTGANVYFQPTNVFNGLDSRVYPITFVGRFTDFNEGEETFSVFPYSSEFVGVLPVQPFADVEPEAMSHSRMPGTNGITQATFVFRVQAITNPGGSPQTTLSILDTKRFLLALANTPQYIEAAALSYEANRINNLEGITRDPIIPRSREVSVDERVIQLSNGTHIVTLTAVTTVNGGDLAAPEMLGILQGDMLAPDGGRISAPLFRLLPPTEGIGVPEVEFATATALRAEGITADIAGVQTAVDTVVTGVGEIRTDVATVDAKTTTVQNAAGFLSANRLGNKGTAPYDSDTDYIPNL